MHDENLNIHPMEYGLNDITLNRIAQVFTSVREIDQAIIYGSRAKGNNKAGSDIDITLKGKKLTVKELNRLSLELDDLLLPYTFDLTIYDHIRNPDLLDHINRVGRIFYSRQDQ